MVSIPFLPNHWYYNTESGQLTNGNNLENLGNNLLGGLGWHELNISGSATGAQAAAEAKKEFPTGATPSYAPVTVGEATGASAVTGDVTSTVSALESALKPVASFFGTLTQAHTWERIGEVLLGIILVAVGLAHMTKAVPIATAIAGKVP